MASDFLLELDGVKGESQDEKHKETIEITSFSWGASQPVSMGGSGLAGGKVSFQDVTFVTEVNKASPELLMACATGKHFKKAQLFVRKAGGTQEDYYKVILEDVMVSSYQTGASAGGDPVPTDSFSLAFAKIKFEYAPQKPDGKLDSPVIATYDLKANKK